MFLHSKSQECSIIVADRDKKDLKRKRKKREIFRCEIIFYLENEFNIKIR